MACVVDTTCREIDMPAFGIVPKNFCKDCNWHNATKQATCKKQAYLSQDPVTAEPVWIGLRVCSDHRVGSRKLDCPDYMEKQ